MIFPLAGLRVKLAKGTSMNAAGGRRGQLIVFGADPQRRAAPTTRRWRQHTRQQRCSFPNNLLALPPWHRIPAAPPSRRRRKLRCLARSPRSGGTRPARHIRRSRRRYIRRRCSPRGGVCHDRPGRPARRVQPGHHRRDRHANPSTARVCAGVRKRSATQPQTGRLTEPAIW